MRFAVLPFALVAALAAENPLLVRRSEVPEKPIPFAQVRPEHVGEAIRIRLEDARERLGGYKSVPGPWTFENTVTAFHEIDADLDFTTRILRTIEATAATPAFRSSISSALPGATAFRQSLQMDPVIAARMQSFAQSPEGRKLQGPAKRLLEVTLDGFRRNGATLDESRRKRLDEINRELQELSLKFSANMTSATAEWEHYVTNEAELAGIPDWLKTAMRADAEKRSRAGWRVTLMGSVPVTIISNADSAALRELVYRATQTIASTGKYNNTVVADRQLVLRAERARLLNYSSFADYQTEDRMARSAVGVNRFLAGLEKGMRPAAERETSELLAFRRSLEGSGAPPLAPWDLNYYGNKLSKKVNGVEPEAFRPFFPLPRVQQGLYAFVKKLYGVDIEPVANSEVLDPSVQYLRIREGGRTLGYLYMDLFVRESKRAGGWMAPMITAEPGKAHLGGIFCNFNAPPPGNPALLTHQQALTLFHEMGHFLHLVLSRSPYPEIGGTSVAWDFVELPSQLMENFLYERAVVDMISGHFETGARLPDDMFAGLQKSRNFRAGTLLLGRTGQSVMDILLHSEYTPADAPGGLQKYSRRIIQNYSMAPLPEDANPVARFQHLFAGAYGAGYYSYLWSEMLDSDAYTRFASDGIFNPATAKSFRTTILERGNTIPAQEAFRDFAGRDPEVKSLLKKYGMAP